MLTEELIQKIEAGKENGHHLFQAVRDGERNN